MAEANALGIVRAARAAGSKDGGTDWNQSFLATALARGYSTSQDSRQVEQVDKAFVADPERHP